MSRRGKEDIFCGWMTGEQSRVGEEQVAAREVIGTGVWV